MSGSGSSSSHRNRIFAVDPGGTTGWVCLELDVGRDAGVNGVGMVTRWKCGEIASVGPGPRSGRRVRQSDGGEVYAAKMVRSLCSRFRPDILVIEDFILDVGRAVMSRDLLSPVRVTAMIEALLRDSGDAELVRLASPLRLEFQSAANAKHVVTNDRLREWGFWIRGQKHARDAMRHGLLYVRRVADGRVNFESFRRFNDERRESKIELRRAHSVR